MLNAVWCIQPFVFIKTICVTQSKVYVYDTVIGKALR